MGVKRSKSEWHFRFHPPFEGINEHVKCKVCWTVFVEEDFDNNIRCPRCLAKEARNIGSKIHNFFARVSYEQDR